MSLLLHPGKSHNPKGVCQAVRTNPPRQVKPNESGEILTPFPSVYHVLHFNIVNDGHMNSQETNSKITRFALKPKFYASNEPKPASSGQIFLRSAAAALLVTFFLCVILLDLFVSSHWDWNLPKVKQQRFDTYTYIKNCPNIWDVYQDSNSSLHCQRVLERKTRDLTQLEQTWLANLSCDNMVKKCESLMELQVSLISNEHILVEKWRPNRSWNETKQVFANGDDLSFILQHESGLAVHLEIGNVSLLPEYVDILHDHSDNGIVLDTSRRSNMHHWRAPLEKLLSTKCRHPIPKHYYLTLHPYMDRHTIARRRHCTSKPGYLPNVTAPICPPGVPHNSVFFERSVNDQCTQNQASFLPSQRNSIYCTSNSPLVNKLFAEYINEKQSYLKDAQCDTQRRICQTCLRRSCFSARTQLSSRQLGTSNELSLLELANDVIWMRDPRTKTMNNSAEQCCAIHCYSSPSCIEYFSPLCQTQTINHAGTQEVCLQGKTLKLTLNPEFDFTNSSYMCHLQYKQPKLLYTVKTWLSINGTWRIGPTVYNVRLSTPDYHDRQRGKETTEEQLHRRKRAVLLQHMHGILRLWSRSIRIEHKLSHRFRTDAILSREPVPGQMLLYSLKSFDDFGTKAVEVHRHRDEKYVTVQFTKPFLYSTDNWGNQSCHVNISDLHHSQPIYNEKNRMIVRLASPISRNEDESFSYVLDDAKENTHINVSWDPGTDASFLRSALCDQEMPLSFKSSEIFSLHKPGSIVDQSELYTTVNKVKTQTAARTERCDYGEAWNITLNGWVTKKPAYLHITVFATRSIHSSASFPAWWTTKKRLLLEEDIILLPVIDEVEQPQRSKKFSTGRTSFTLRFVAQLRLSPILTDQLQHVHIVLRDCQRTRRAQVTLQIDRKLQCNTTIGNLSTVAELKPIHLFFTLRMIKTDKFHAPFILSCILTVSAHIVLLIVYSFGRICARTNRVRNDGSSMRSTGEAHLGNIYYSTNVLSSASGFSSHRPVHMTGTRKALLMIYLCFRVFYTFLFTTSVGLALLLSTESNAAREFTAVIHNKLSQARTSESHQKPAEHTLNSKYHAITSYQLERQQLGTNHWVAEVTKMEQFAHSELTKQLKMIDAQLSECNEHKRSSHLKIIRLIQRSKKLGKEWMNPARETVNLMHAMNLSASDTDEQSPRGLKSHNLTWTSDPLELKFPSLQGSTWKFLEQFQWSPYLDTVDEHLRKIRDDLDTHVIDCWAPFDRLLNRLLENSWITPARRAMNATWLHVNNLATISATGDPRLSGALDDTVYANRQEQSSRSPPEQRQRIEAKSLKLARFLGVPQPEQARLTGARIWNNFRRLVLPLPNRFHYDVSQLYLGGSRLSELTPVATPFYDHRYFFSTDDRQHIYGGNLEEFRFEAPRSRRTRPYRYATQIGMRLRPSSTSSAIYLLSLTQVRLLLLALDAFIILTRCIRTYRLTQRVWYGKVKKLYLDQIQSSPLTSLPKKLNDFSLLMGDLPGFTDDISGEQLSGPYSNHANIPKIESHPTLRMLSPTNLAPHSPVASMRQSSRYHQLQPCLMDHVERFDPPRLCVRSADIASEANAGPGRLTACYCCLDDHYIIIVLGLGLLLVGLFIVWAADRHIRPGSILVRTGVHPRTQALEECHHRTNAILQALHPVYWNRRSLKDHHRMVDKENKRAEQTLNRLHQEQVQLYELYLAELCTLHSGPNHQPNVPGVTGKAQFDRIREQIPSDSSSELMRVSAGSPCILFDQSMRFTAQFRRALLRQMNYMDSDSAISWLPVCLFTPLTVSAQTQDQSKRFLSNTGLGGISLSQDTVFARNETAPAKSTHADLAASIGSLATMVYACHRLILTGLTIALTASGLISLLHLIKLMIRHTVSLRIKKIVLIIPYPVHTRPSPEDAVQLSPFDHSMGRRVTQQVR